MAGEDNPFGFILGSIKAEIDVHLGAPHSYLQVMMDKPETDSAGNQARSERRNGWVTPLYVFLSLLLPLVTAEFKPFIVDPLIWRIIYKILTAAAFIWLLLSIYSSFHSSSVRQKLAKIKAETQG